MDMKLFEVTFPNNNICDCTDLYYRSALHNANFDGEKLEIPDGATVTFDTFFNLFSCAKFLKHTTLNKVILRLEACGQFKLEVVHACGEMKESWCWADGISMRKGTEQTVGEPMPPSALKQSSVFHAELDVPEKGIVEIPIDFSQYSSGYLYFSITAKGGAALYSAAYHAEERGLNVKIGLVICTYKRESFVKRNVTNILNYLQANPELEGALEVFVIDNGHTLKEDDVRGVHLVYNKNLGGSGGFTRGIIEVLSRNNFTHILLSDDDVVYPTEIFRKTISLLSFAKNPEKMAVGAAMLKLDKPFVQHELGADWNKRCMHVVSPKRGFDLTKQAALVKNEELGDCDYSAWWYLCMPVCRIKETGLPFPFFIKQDDVEYGVRCNFEFALMNGLGVWHEPFENKYSAYLEYYGVRNVLISDCVTKRSGGWKAFWWVVADAGIQLVYQRYFVLPFIFSACNDFLKGARHFSEIDGEKLNGKLISQNLKQQTKQQLLAQGYNLEDFYSPKNKKTVGQVLSLNGYLIPSCFYSKQNRKYRTIDVRNCYPSQFFKLKGSVQYNPVSETGFVTKQKLGKVFSTGFKLLWLGMRMMFCYGKAARSYRKKLPELTSEQSWQKRLEMNGENNTEDNKE